MIPCVVQDGESRGAKSEYSRQKPKRLFPGENFF